MHVSDILPMANKSLLIVRADGLLNETAALLSDNRDSLVIVCDESGAMVGVVSKTDVVRRIGTCMGGACLKQVQDVMAQSVISCHPDDSLTDVWDVMKERNFVHLPVVDARKKPLGVLSARAVLHALLGEVEHQESLLRDYVMGLGYR